MPVGEITVVYYWLKPKLRNLNATLRRRRIFLLGWQIYRKFARQYVNSIVTSRSRDVTSLFRHLPYDVLFKKLGIVSIFDSVNWVYWGFPDSESAN